MLADMLKDEKIFFAVEQLPFRVIPCQLTSPNKGWRSQTLAQHVPTQWGGAACGSLQRMTGAVDLQNGATKRERECLEANSGKGSWRGFSESLTPFGKEFEVYYLGNKETIKDF